MLKKIWQNLEWIFLAIGTVVMITSIFVPSVMTAKILFSGLIIAEMGIPFALNVGR